MQHFTVQRGDSWVATIRATNADTSVLDLTGWTVVAGLREGPTKDATIAPTPLTATITDAANGLIRVSLPRLHRLKVGFRYHGEVDIRRDNESLTAMKATFDVQPSVVST